MTTPGPTTGWLKVLKTSGMGSAVYGYMQQVSKAMQPDHQHETGHQPGLTWLMAVHAAVAVST